MNPSPPSASAPTPPEPPRIVLVRPTRSGNVGSACRAMMNFGLRDLVLVDPACEPRDEQGFDMAHRAAAVLEASRVVRDIPDALAGCVRSYALSARGGMYRAACSVEEAVREAVELRASGKAVFVFGPESTGLLDADLVHFDRVVTIATDNAYPTLNLAAAVLIVCYEWRRAVNMSPHSGPRALACAEHCAAMFQKLFQALDEIGFTDPRQPEKLKIALRQLLGRAALSPTEADILIGLAQQIRSRAGRPLRDPPPETAC